MIGAIPFMFICVIYFANFDDDDDFSLPFMCHSYHLIPLEFDWFIIVSTFQSHPMPCAYFS